MTFRTSHPLPFVAFCTGLLVIGLLNNVVFEAVVRNQAFVALAKGFLQPTLTLDSHLRRSLALFDRVSPYHPARYQPYQIRLQGLIETLHSPALSEGRIRLPAGSARSGISDSQELTTAIGYTLSIIAQGSAADKDSAVQELTGLLESQPELADFKGSFYTTADSRSSFPATFSGCPGVELIALYIDEQSIGIRQSVPIVIIWRINPENTQADVTRDGAFRQWELRRSGSFLFQIGAAINQIPDGGFEQTVLPREGLPLSLPQQYYGTQSRQHTQMIYEFPATGQNIVLLLDGQGQSYVSLASLPMSIAATPPEEAYLVTGRYRTVGEAMPRIGLRWLRKDAREWNDNISSYIVQRNAAEWTSFAGITPTHTEAESFQYWVINVSATSQLYVDDLGLFATPLLCR